MKNRNISLSLGIVSMVSVLSLPYLNAQEVGAEVVGEDQGELQADPSDDLFRIANMLYDQAQQPEARADGQERARLLGLAATRYDDYVKKFPQEKNAPAALYRQSLCLLELGKVMEAQVALTALVTQYPQGPIAAAAAYRLGSFAMNEKKQDVALRYYTLAAQQTDKDELRTDAYYRIARIYMTNNQKGEAAKAFRLVIDNPKTPNNLKYASLLSLASIEIEANRLSEALKLYEVLLTDNSKVDPKILGEAMIHAASVANKLNQPEKAIRFYQAILRDKKLEAFMPQAQIDMMTFYYGQKKYQDVLDTIQKYPINVDAKLGARRAMLAGQSAILLKKYQDAIVYLGEVERLMPLTEQALESAYRRLLCAQELKQDTFHKTVENFMSVYETKFPDNPYIHIIRVKQAEAIAGNDMAKAAEVFAKIDTEKLPVEMRADVLFKRAWILGKASDRNTGLRAWEDFIQQYPSDKRLPEALVLRGELYKAMNDDVAAMGDFNRVIKEFPKNPAAASAWQILAQLYNEKQDKPNMIKAYKGLIENFQKEKPLAIAEAHYMIGKGHFDLKEFDQAIPHLKEAKVLRSEKYGTQSMLLMVLCFYQKQDAAQLREAYDTLVKEDKASANTLPDSIPLFIGSQCFAVKDYSGANKYLSLASNSAEPQRTKKAVWFSLAKARFHIGEFERAKKAIDFFLAAEDAPARRAQGLLDKSIILFHLKDFAGAKQCAEESLKTGVDGAIKATLNILLGDIAYAEGNFAEAGRLYGTTSALFTSDKQVKAPALYKAAVSLEKAGKDSDAEVFRKDLKQEFPQWKPTETIFQPMID